jgi:hypothetical protein
VRLRALNRTTNVMLISTKQKLNIIKAAVICCGCVFALTFGVTLYVNADATIHPDTLHTHRHESRGSVRYFTDVEDQLNSGATYVFITAIAAFAVLNFFYTRIKDREQKRALEAQLAIDDQHPENIR